MLKINSVYHRLVRRALLKGLAAWAVALVLPARAFAYWLKNFPVRTVEKHDWRFDPQSGKVVSENRAPETYQLVVDGLVESPVRLSHQELKQLPQEKQVSDFHCVEGWSVADLAWEGFRFVELAKLVKPKPEAAWVVFHSLGQTRFAAGGLKHYLEAFPLAELLDPKRRILLAMKLDGKPLDFSHGSPLRLLAPLDLAYKSIKYVTRAEFTDKAQAGWWTRANPIYPITARAPQERLRRK